MIRKLWQRGKIHSSYIRNESTYLLTSEESPSPSSSNKDSRGRFSTVADANNVRFRRESQIRPTDVGVNCHFLSSREHAQPFSRDKTEACVYPNLYVGRKSAWAIPLSLSNDSLALYSCDRRVHAHSIKSVYTRSIPIIKSHHVVSSCVSRIYDMTLHARGAFGEINRGERSRTRTQCSISFSPILVAI